MKNILVTGAGGFIGSHLMELLVKNNYNVTALVHYNSLNSWGWLEETEILNDCKVITGDVCNYDCVFDALKGMDTIFHLAALIGIPYSYISPLAYIKTNINGTYNVLQAAKEHNLENILITSTSETYGSSQYIPIDEKHPLVGQSPYSASKIGADQLAISYFRSFNIPIKIVRPFNTYGPRQSARAIIPTVISQILTGQKSIIIGNLHPTRDLTYVKDTVKGFLEIAKSEKLIGEVINIGMNTEITIKKIIDNIIEILDANIKIIQNDSRIRPKESEVLRLNCDNSKILKNTNWKPEFDFKTGLIQTIDWFKSNNKLYKSRIYNI